ncbi:MAG TPA: pyridoxal-dependent decarboxylase [Gemmatimonadaceae bacterium]|nr:pyridoxal-dependent decarboxylase [Gemmatimonadaceae bacterium]
MTPDHADLTPLDPRDWESYRALAHRMLDESLDYLRDVRERPTWTPTPGDVKAEIHAEPVPRSGRGDAAAYEDFLRLVRPYPNGNIHPRFWGWVMGTGTPQSAMADFLSSVVNPQMGGLDHAPVYVEQQVVKWFAELLRFPAAAGGILISGGTMANVLGLAVARVQRAGWDVRKTGAAGGPPLRVYASGEVHSWLAKACEFLGMGNDAFRRVPVHGDFTVDVAAMARMIAEDRAAGARPFCIVGTVGTVQTGASDDLVALADLAEREGLWLHVDGAFGAMASLSEMPEAQAAVRGLDRADSVAFDLHKWGYMPFDVAMLLTRDDAHLTQTFANQAPYLTAMPGGLNASGSVYFNDRGIELTRSFRALKVWMTLRAQGSELLGAHIGRNIAQAQYLAGLVAREAELELLAPVPLNLVNYRFRATGLDVDALNALNRNILVRLQEDGIAVPSGTMIRGQFAIRVAVTNHRSRDEDFELLLRETLRIGRELTRARTGP